VSQTEYSQNLLDHCINETDASGRLPDYRGKVRDIYNLPDNQMAIVVTDRISAFDHIFPEAIPFKGQLLNLIAWHNFKAIQPVCPHHVLDVPHPNVTIARRCDPLPVEVVVRGYLAGHAWRVYDQGGRTLCGKKLPEGLRRNEALPEPLITPTTKATRGHDEDISEDEIISGGLVHPDRWEEIRRVSLSLFDQGSEMAAQKGLILVDTKYEFGISNNELVLIDEVHTPDSSRYFYADEYEKRLAEDAPQKQLSKEFLREWLIENRHHENLDNQLPRLPDDLRISIYERYRELYEKLTGTSFEPTPTPGFNAFLADLLAWYDRK